MPHQTVKVPVEQELVDVDVGIVPVVYWLNSIAGIKTIFSCQGQDDFEWPPYVMFLAEPAVIEREVLPLLEIFHFQNGCYLNDPVDVILDLFRGERRWKMVWQSEAHLKAFIDYLHDRLLTNTSFMLQSEPWYV